MFSRFPEGFRTKLKEEKCEFFCECNGHNVPGHSKRARTCLGCRMEARLFIVKNYKYGTRPKKWRGKAGQHYPKL